MKAVLIGSQGAVRVCIGLCHRVLSQLLRELYPLVTNRVVPLSYRESRTLKLLIELYPKVTKRVVPVSYQERVVPLRVTSGHFVPQRVASCFYAPGLTEVVKCDPVLCK